MAQLLTRLQGNGATARSAFGGSSIAIAGSVSLASRGASSLCRWCSAAAVLHQLAAQLLPAR